MQASSACNYPLKNGGLCKQMVGFQSDHCAAGHPKIRALPHEQLVQQRDGCQMRRVDYGWVCDTHNLDSEEWQVIMALGARFPCRIPGTEKERRTMARRTKVPFVTRRLLAEDASIHVRAELVMNRNCTGDVLHQIITNSQKDTWVMKRVARHPNLRPETILPVARSERRPFMDIQMELLARTHVPEDALLYMAKSTRPEVRRGVAGHTSASRSLLTMLSADLDYAVRARVAGNPNTPSEVLEQLATDKRALVRAGVAANALTPVSILERLSKDPMHSVQEPARRRLSWDGKGALARWMREMGKGRQ